MTPTKTKAAPKKSATPKTVMPLTAKEIAAQYESTPRRVRKFLRAQNEAVGRGNRYALTAGEVKKLHKQFKTWEAQVDKAGDSK